MLKVVRKIRTDENFIDVCECPEFMSPISGLGIAWSIATMDLLLNATCAVVFVDPTTQKSTPIPTKIKEITASDFINNSINKNPSIVLIEGMYRSISISSSVLMEEKKITFSYPRQFDGQIAPLIKGVSNAIKEHFTLLTFRSSRNVGCKICAHFTSPLFHSKADGLLITAAASNLPDTTIRWQCVYLNGIERNDSSYGALIERRRITPWTFVEENQNKDAAKANLTIFWKGKHISVSCFFKEKIIQITWDKWLGRDVDVFIYKLNTVLYELYYGHIGAVD